MIIKAPETNKGRVWVNWDACLEPGESMTEAALETSFEYPEDRIEITDDTQA